MELDLPYYPYDRKKAAQYATGYLKAGGVFITCDHGVEMPLLADLRYMDLPHQIRVLSSGRLLDLTSASLLESEMYPEPEWWTEFLRLTLPPTLSSWKDYKLKWEIKDVVCWTNDQMIADVEITYRLWYRRHLPKKDSCYSVIRDTGFVEFWNLKGKEVEIMTKGRYSIKEIEMMNFAVLY